MDNALTRLAGAALPPQTILIIGFVGGVLLLLWLATSRSGSGSLNIKSKVVGDGQHGTARWATRKEIQQTYKHVPFHVKEWRSGRNLPKVQGLVLGCVGRKHSVTALVDQDDIHCLMIGASGVGQDGVFPLPKSGIRLCQQDTFSGPGYQRRLGPKLRCRGLEVLRLQGRGD